MADSPRCVELSGRIYEVLIHAYPASFRREYGSEMARVFREMTTDAFRQRGAIGLILTWFRVLGDLVCTASREHLMESERSIEMKRAAFALFSVVVAAIVHHFVMAMVAIALATVGFIVSGGSYGISPNPVLELTLLFLPALLTGVVLTRAKPFFRPRVTGPAGIMAYWGLVCFLGGGPPWWAGIGLVASVGLVGLLGCIVGTKASSRLEKISLPSSLLAGTLSVLICALSVACVLWFVLIGNQLGADFRPVLVVCLLALLLIAAVAIANLVYFAVRTRTRVERNG